MSAIGTKRTYRVALHMSAFGGKADMTAEAPIAARHRSTPSRPCNCYNSG